MSIDISNIQSAPQPNEKKDGNGFMDILNKDIQLFGQKFNDKKKERFYSEMNILFSSGLDIKTVLELIEAEQTKEKEKILFTQIKDDVVKGMSLSDALKASGKFSDYEYHSIKIGEETGKLTHILIDLSEYYTRKIKQRRQIVGAMTYPAIVISFALLVTTLMLKYLVPMFADIFKRFNAELPAITRYTIKISEWVDHYFIYGLTGILLIGFSIYQSRNKTWYKKYSSTLILKLPFVGKFVEKVYMARFCQNMSLLIGAKTNLVDALELTKNMMGFYPVDSTIDPIKEQIMKGKSLHECLAMYPIYNHRLVSLIKVAEEVNKLDSMFSRMSKQYSEELDHESKVITNLMEPLIVIFLGLVVCLVLVSMYLPMFQLGNVIK